MLLTMVMRMMLILSYLENILVSLWICRNSDKIEAVAREAHKAAKTNSYRDDGEPHHEATQVPHQ